MTEFVAWPKTARLFRECVISEKIDGTNAAVIITDDGAVYAQSRKRVITPDDDNFGFARWAAENAGVLVDTLGPGRHYGEWWGSGIQRGYGLTNGDKRFSLFNTGRHTEADVAYVPQMTVVPVLYDGEFTTGAVRAALDDLRVNGSLASPGFMRPEGVCVFHTQSRQVYKATLENDGVPKSALGVAS